MVDVVALLAILFGAVTLGAEIGLYVHLLLLRPRPRCPRCGTKNTAQRRRDPILVCRSCRREYSATTTT